MNHIPATASMAKLYEAQGYFQDSKEVYARMGKDPGPAKPAHQKIKTSHKKNQNSVLPTSLEIKIDQWVTLQLVQRQTELWKDRHLQKAQKPK